VETGGTGDITDFPLLQASDFILISESRLLLRSDFIAPELVKTSEPLTEGRDGACSI
jgi:hypothetical protein